MFYRLYHPVTRPTPILHTLKPPSLVFSLGGPFRISTNTNNLLTRRKKKHTFTPSKEQQEIAILCGTKNVVVSARPGSGKTATAEAIVAAHPNKRVAVLTYSKRLQLETQRRLHTYSNCEVYTFHALAGLLFGTLIRDDASLVEQRRRALDRNELPRWDSAPFDIIILDEFQDCTSLLFWLTNCFILANNHKAGGKPARLVVLGDERQSIYGFRGADERYLTLAPDLLALVSPYPFVRAQLSRSFRLSEQSVQFINSTFLGGEPYITSSKSGPKPIILRCHHRNSYALAKQLFALIQRYGAKNTAIIAPAVRKPGPLQNVVNILSKNFRVPISVSIWDEASLDDRVIKGKLCVSSIHQFKGSERDLIILFGLDSSFLDYFGRHLPDDRCPNEVFVALTRPAAQLVLIHYEDAKIMPFASVEALYETAMVIDMTKKKDKIKPAAAPGRPLQLGLTLPRSMAVRDMPRHIEDEHLHDIVHDHVCIQVHAPLPEDQHINLPSVVLSDKGKWFHEAVSDLNGMVVVAAFEHMIAGTLTALGLPGQRKSDAISEIYSREGVSWLSRKACDYEARSSGYLPRSIQMANHRFDWIKPDHLALACTRLRRELSRTVGKPKFEVKAKGGFRIGKSGPDTKTCKLDGRADIVAALPNSDGNNLKGVETVWEIKFVAKLSNQHVIQACTYAYLLKLPRVILYNVRNGEKWEITSRDGQAGLHRMVERVLRLKYTTDGKMSDEEFTERCTRVSLEVLNLRP